MAEIEILNPFEQHEGRTMSAEVLKKRGERSTARKKEGTMQDHEGMSREQPTTNNANMPRSKQKSTKNSYPT
jgi:hypothetical protein